MFEVIYNEGQGFTECRKTYATLSEAVKKEGLEMCEAHIYKDGERIQ